MHKTADSLGISQTLYDALKKVQHNLITGKIENKRFNMSYWGKEIRGCGTVCCIGGWATTYMVGVAQPIPYYTAGLHDLFYPYDVGHEWHHITPQHAAAAIENYLTYGYPYWQRAMDNPMTELSKTDQETITITTIDTQFINNACPEVSDNSVSASSPVSSPKTS